MSNMQPLNQNRPVSQVFIGKFTVDDIVVRNTKTMLLGKPGGGVMYSSAGAALWGDKTGIVGNIGTSFSENSLSNLSSYANLDVSGIHRKLGTGVNLWVLYDENNEREFVVKRNSSSYSAFDPIPSDIPTTFIESSNIFHIAPFVLENQATIVDFLNQKGKVITLDPDIESCGHCYLDQWHDLLRKIDVFLPSEIEFKMLIGEDAELSIEYYCEKLKRFAAVHEIKYTVLKLGVNGVLLYDLKKDKCSVYPVAKCNETDCTGAGDSFVGGFCHKYKETQNPYEAIPYGIVTAAINIEGVGSEFLLTKCRGEAEDRLMDYLSKKL